MLQRNPNVHPNRRAGVIAACVVGIAAVGTFVVASSRGADDEPSRPSPEEVTEQAERRQQAIEDAAGSDQHLEMLAAELAEQAAARQQAIEDAAGSDHHLEMLAAELAEQAAARQQAIEDARWSDRRLGPR
jgi:hypothetical protein